MQRELSATVRVTFPRHTRSEVEKQLRSKTVAYSKKLPFLRVILFGSYASNRYTASSDVDVVVVYSGRRLDDAYERFSAALDVEQLELQVYQEREFDLLKKNNPLFAKELENGVQIFP